MHVMFVCVFRERESLREREKREKDLQKIHSLNERDIFKHRTQL